MALTMDDRDGKIWHNGELVDWRDAKVHVLTHTLHYGMGVFEGVRAYETPKGPAIFRLQEHTKRLFTSAKILGMKLPYSQEEINQAHIDVVKANNLASCYFRPMAYYGSKKLGVAPAPDDVQVMLAAWPWGAYLGEEGMRRGIRVRVSSYTRHHPNIHMIKAKANGNYLNSILANTEATRDGYDEAILLDADALCFIDPQFLFVAEGYQASGMLLFKDEKHQYLLAVNKQGENKSVFLKRIGESEQVLASDTISEKTKEIYLKVISQGTHYDFYYSVKGEKDWTLLCKDVDASYLSTATAGGFTGSVIGLYAVCK